MKRIVLAVVAALVAVGGVTVVDAVSSDSTAAAADARDFDPGMIISDQVFYDRSTMSVSAIQSFLNARVPTCAATSGPTCLKSYRTNTTSKPGESGRCSAYAGRSNQSAAQIIYDVAQVCGINPRSLIVLLEKEQSLVTDSSPTDRQYRSATGYGCPDTADCDSQYYGFFNQVYSAALQFKRYAAAPTGRAYEAGRNNSILYHPNTACGTKTVYIKNQATAGLYLYTPYTPNAAALAKLYGTGDSCSSYGNRNFWRLFTDWFGSTKGNDSPSGDVTRAVGGYRAIEVSGTASDPNSSSPIRVHVYVDGVGKASVVADRSTSTGANGFTARVGGLDPGVRSVCVFGINVGAGSNTLLRCVRVAIPSANPFGVIDEAAGAPGQFTFRGWAIDPDTVDPIRVHVYVDGVGRASIAADGVKAGLDGAKPGFGDRHGFAGTIGGVTPGAHTVCVYAINVLAGSNTRIGCDRVSMPSGSPTGAFESAVAPDVGVIDVTGWAYDPDVVDPIRVHLYVDGRGWASIAADVERTSPTWPGYGTAHGFSTRLSGLAPGSHRVCAYAINVGAGGNAGLGCIDVTMPQGSPKIWVDEAAAGSAPGTAFVRGWAFDPDTIDPIRVHVYVDGVGAASVEASLVKEGLGDVFPGIGDLHGFRADLAGLGPGAHSICVYAINKAGPGSTTSAGCRTVTVP
ncbi:hypothetical protein GCM10017608_23040 [Agromyces luteolus]|uniref:hypothetical protein n=1 Tax=Agromyces luteolus TaxID=88373 RepID=UPI00141265FB|nr:hypothetical protein [Agromyces luteolus]GLK28370.1 hypothetical protein GCM10017608_23040 [Agromyces luteolus]